MDCQIPVRDLAYYFHLEGCVTKGMSWKTHHLTLPLPILGNSFSLLSSISKWRLQLQNKAVDQDERYNVIYITAQEKMTVSFSLTLQWWPLYSFIVCIVVRNSEVQWAASKKYHLWYLVSTVEFKIICISINTHWSV